MPPSRLDKPVDFGMTDLDEKLSGAEAGAVRAEVGVRLAAKAEDLRKLMSAGLSPEDYQKAKLAHAGVTAAYDIITRRARIQH
jgi:hypothetical protein